MRFYNENKMYFWEIDRFSLFTESEKCSILEGLRYQLQIWEFVEDPDTEGGIVSMLDILIKEVEKSLDDE